jgi:predicted HAD superfamily Cof-like phosphohydrolase
MTAEQRKVLEFHERFDAYRQSCPSVPDGKVVTLRLRLIEEELQELESALARKDIVATADALGDLLYVTYGTAVACGIDLEPVFNEIHRSNMTKSPLTRRADNKVLKGPAYMPPDLEPILRAQGMRPADEPTVLRKRKAR